MASPGRHDQPVAPPGLPGRAAPVGGREGRLNSGDLLGWHERIGSATEAPQTAGNGLHELQAGGAASGTETGHPRPVEVAGGGKTGQGRGDQSQVAPEAEPHTTEPIGAIALPQPGRRRRRISEQLVRGHLITMLTAKGQTLGVVAQIQGRSGAREGADRQGAIALPRQPIRHAAHPSIHPEHLRQHQHRAARLALGGTRPPSRHGQLGNAGAGAHRNRDPFGPDGTGEGRYGSHRTAAKGGFPSCADGRQRHLRRPPAQAS